MKTPKLTFDLQEIPDGKSSREVTLLADDLNLDSEKRFLKADVMVDFYKTDRFVQVIFDLKADVELICDRSLKPFVHSVNGAYQILFEPDPIEESETDKSAVRQIPADSLVISVEKELVDTIMLKLPVRSIHPDYLNSDGVPEDFETRVFGPEPDEDELIDPRWAELKKLK